MATELGSLPSRRPRAPKVFADAPQPKPGHCECGKRISRGARRCAVCARQEAVELSEKCAAMEAQGMIVPDIAGTLGVSKSTVYLALRRADKVGIARQRQGAR
jgi:hypothetical protein